MRHAASANLIRLAPRQFCVVVGAEQGQVTLNTALWQRIRNKSPQTALKYTTDDLLGGSNFASVFA